MGRCIGRFRRALDEKGRVTLPSKLRRALLSPEESSVVVLAGHEGCLYVYPVQRFVDEADGISGGSTASKSQRDVRRSMAIDADEQDVDGQGRVLLTDELREHAGIGKKGRVVFLGVMTFVEVWSLERYRERVEPLRGRLDELTEKLHEEER
jgi:MraZ protein